jgi:hypothetical protein
MKIAPSGAMPINSLSHPHWSVDSQIGTVIKVDPSPKYVQQDDGLHLDIMLAQRIYNNSLWPNPVVVKLTAVSSESK